MRGVTSEPPEYGSSDTTVKSRNDLMIESVRIDNFRCFESVDVDDLDLVNLVVGDNAVGKTSLLEALYFVATNTPEAHARFLAWRGVLDATTPLSLKREQWSSGAFWLDLFHQYDESRRITVNVEGTPDRSLEIFFRKKQEDTIGPGQKAPVAFKWDGEAFDEPFVSVPRYADGGIDLPTAPGDVIRGAFLAEGAGYSDIAERYSDLSIKKASDRVKQVICNQFPQIRDLSVEASPAGGNMLYADVTGVPKLIPLPLVSSGIATLTYILTTMARYPGGSIFVDEFAKGIYHDRLPEIWSAIHSLAKETGTQIFLATHSGEAIESLGPVAENNPADFRVVGITRDDEAGASHAQVTHGENLASAIEFHIDVR